MEEQTKSSTTTKDYRRWQKEIEAAKKRTRKFRERGIKVVRRFLDERGAGDGDHKKLNLFHNHVSTLQAMLYGRLPRVEVSRRHSDSNDDVARIGSLILNRMLNNDVQENGSRYSDLLRSSLQDRLLPGLGTARVYYDLEVEEEEIPEQIDELTGEVTPAYTEQRVLWEEAGMEYVHWQDFLWGFGRCWSEVPWVAFRSYIGKKEAEKRFGKKIADKLVYIHQNPTGEKGEVEELEKEQQDPNEKAEVWEIWCKKSQRVYWFSEGLGKLCDNKEDPLGLKGFFPCPVPMMANVTTSIFVPKSDFMLSQDLYNEIDRLQDRIHHLTKSLKVVGVYDKNNDGMKRMLAEGTENELIPVDNWAMFAEKGGIKGTVDWFPLEVVAATLDKLRVQRDETIRLLYQVTGLADILQGANAGGGQPTSATEQALRAKFASVRVQYLQDEFARFASELLSLRSEVIARHFEAESIVQQSNIQFSHDQQDLVMQAVELIKNPEQSMWRIEVKPESIAMIDYAQLKAERTEYLTSLATFLQSAQAVGKIEPEMGPILMELMKWGLAGFKGSQEIEGVVDKGVQALQQKIQAAKNQPPPPSPEEIKAKAEQAKHEREMQRDAQKAQLEMQKLMAEFQADLKLIKEKLGAEVTKEIVQADSFIREKQAEAQYRPKETSE